MGAVPAAGRDQERQHGGADDELAAAAPRRGRRFGRAAGRARRLDQGAIADGLGLAARQGLRFATLHTGVDPLDLLEPLEPDRRRFIALPVHGGNLP